MYFLYLFISLFLASGENISTNDFKSIRDSEKAELTSCTLNVFLGNIFEYGCYHTVAGFKIGSDDGNVLDVIWNSPSGSTIISEGPLGCCGRRIKVNAPTRCEPNEGPSGQTYLDVSFQALVDGCGWVTFNGTYLIGSACC